MTVSSSISRTIHLTNSAVTDYTFNFKVFAADDLRVTVVIDRADHDLTLWSDYAVSGVGEESGGKISLTAAGAAKAGDGHSLVILREMPFLQEIDFREHGRMPSELVEKANDIAAMERQQLMEKLGRAMLGPADTTAPLDYGEFEKLRDAAQQASHEAAAAAEAANNALGAANAAADAAQEAVVRVNDALVGMEMIQATVEEKLAEIEIIAAEAAAAAGRAGEEADRAAAAAGVAEGDLPLPASQAAVDAGEDNTGFVTARTLANITPKRLTVKDLAPITETESKALAETPAGAQAKVEKAFTDAKTLIEELQTQIDELSKSGAGAYLGDIRLFPFRRTELPFGWYYPSGEYVAQSSAIGAALLALPANLKSDWGIVISGVNIRLCDNTKFVYGSYYGRFPRMAGYYNPGVVEADAIRNISGNMGVSRAINNTTQTGPFASATSTTSATGTGGEAYQPYLISFNASRVVATAAENRPYAVYMTPAIYLGA